MSNETQKWNKSFEESVDVLDDWSLDLEKEIQNDLKEKSSSNPHHSSSDLAGQEDSEDEHEEW